MHSFVIFIIFLNCDNFSLEVLVQQDDTDIAILQNNFAQVSPDCRRVHAGEISALRSESANCGGFGRSGSAKVVDGSQRTANTDFWADFASSHTIDHRFIRSE
jgi:hypothetical protein